MPTTDDGRTRDDSSSAVQWHKAKLTTKQASKKERQERKKERKKERIERKAKKSRKKEINQLIHQSINKHLNLLQSSPVVDVFHDRLSRRPPQVHRLDAIENNGMGLYH